MASSNTSNGASVANSTKEPTPGDKPAAGDAAATGAFASRAKQALEAWQTLENALANVSSHAQDFANFASAIDLHINTEAELQKKDARIASLETTIQNQFNGLEVRFGKWAVIKKELEEKIAKKEAASDARLKDVAQKIKAAHAQEVEKLKKALQDEKKKSAALEGKLADANSETRKAEESFAKCSEEVDEWNGYVSELKEVDLKKFTAKIKPLSDRCRAIARTHFFTDLPERLLLDQTQWDSLPDTLDIPLTFPPSNSPVAKNIRTAASLHIIARTLYSEIFKPTYIPSSPHFAESLKNVLITQFNANETKERIIRALVLDTYSDQEDTIDATIKQTVWGAAAAIRNLLTPIGAGEGFERDLEALFEDAADVWRNMAQYSVKMIVALTLDERPNQPWITLDEFTIPPLPSSTTTTTTATVSTTPTGDPGAPSFERTLNLFPRIYVPESDRMVFSGITLLYSQGIMAAAEKEFNECMQARRQRTVRSTAGAIGNAFLGGGGGTKRRMSSFSDAKGRFPTVAAVGAAAGGEEGTQQRGQGGNKNGNN